MDFRITLKFLKSAASPVVAATLQPGLDAFEVIDKDYTANNTTETILSLIVRKHTDLTLTFDLFTPVRRVVLDRTDLSFEIAENQLTVKLPAQHNNNDRTADMHMIVPFSGVDLRLEVARPNQCAGEYEKGSFPLAARRAAMTVEFALLDALKALKMDSTIGLGPCGPIMLMGFDTNNPCGHTDWPPHIHLHMTRPAYGAPIGHYYFDENLRFSHNILYLRKIKAPTKQLGRDEPCLHYSPDGSVLFDLMITATGGLCLSSASNERVYIEPNGTGFDSGAVVKTSTTMNSIVVHISDEAGEIQLHRGETASSYTFDIDTGGYLGQSNKVAAADESSATGPFHSKQEDNNLPPES